MLRECVGMEWWGLVMIRNLSVDFRDIVLLLWCLSQHWGEVFLHHNPTSTVRTCACRRSLLCVMLRLYWQGYSLFGKNRQIEHSNFKGKYTTLFCKRILKTWEKEKGIVGVNVTKRESFNPNRSLDYNRYILTIVWYCFLTSFFYWHFVCLCNLT